MQSDGCLCQLGHLGKGAFLPCLCLPRRRAVRARSRVPRASPCLLVLPVPARSVSAAQCVRPRALLHVVQCEPKACLTARPLRVVRTPKGSVSAPTVVKKSQRAPTLSWLGACPITTGMCTSKRKGLVKRTFGSILTGLRLSGYG